MVNQAAGLNSFWLHFTASCTGIPIGSGFWGWKWKWAGFWWCGVPSAGCL